MDLQRRSSSPGPYGTVTGYAIAALAAAIAAVGTRFLWHLGDSAIFPLFFGAVAIAGWYGGLGPGLFATALSGIVTAFLLLPANDTFAAARDDVLRLLVFTLVSVLTSSLHAATRRSREQEQKARQAAEDAAAAKGRFIAMVSHELRNPLNPVMILASALEQDTSLPAPVREDAASIRRSVDLEVRLIDDLLDLNRVSSGKLRLHMEDVDLSEPLKAALRTCEEDLRRKCIDLELEFCDRELHVNGDPLRLQQIFWNLMRNAIKFTPAGGRVTVRSCVGSHAAIVEISDTGIGIEPPRLAAIFHAFEQAGPDIAARFGGLGLGLAICRALAEAHGGTVRAASEGHGRGATFIVTLPIIEARPPFDPEHRARLISAS